MVPPIVIAKWMTLRFIDFKASEPKPATSPSVVSSGLNDSGSNDSGSNDSGSNDSAESNLEGWFCFAQPFITSILHGFDKFPCKKFFARFVLDYLSVCYKGNKNTLLVMA